MHILIVDDQHRVREALVTGLSLFGHDVAEAANGAEALAHLERRTPDVLVTDLDMPTMNGIELILEARRAYPALPIVLMSGGVFEDCEALNAVQDLDCKLRKPFSAQQLLGAIESVLPS